MAPRGKSINLYLMDGTAIGRIKCTLANWTGVAYKIPRGELEKCTERYDLRQSGVYFLFGTSDETGESVVYIGQAGVRKTGEGILCRLQEHKRSTDKDYWTDAVVFTTSNNSFGPTEISYLENRFCNMAISAKRYTVKNSNDPTLGNITEEKESELEEFIDNAKIVMGALGYRVFEPLIEIKPKIDTHIDLHDEPPIFCISKSTADAQGKLTNEGFVVLAGSKIRGDTVPSCPNYAILMRDENKEHIDENLFLKEDVLFRTPSGASSFVLGASTNGYIEWKTKDGKTLREVESMLSEKVM